MKLRGLAFPISSLNNKRTRHHGLSNVQYPSPKFSLTLICIFLVPWYTVVVAPPVSAPLASDAAQPRTSVPAQVATNNKIVDQVRKKNSWFWIEFQFPCLFEISDVARMEILVAHEIFIRHVWSLAVGFAWQARRRLQVDDCKCASNGIRVKGHMTSVKRSCSEKRNFYSSFSTAIEWSAANDHGCYDAWRWDIKIYHHRSISCFWKSSDCNYRCLFLFCDREKSRRSVRYMILFSVLQRSTAKYRRSRQRERSLMKLPPNKKRCKKIISIWSW